MIPNSPRSPATEVWRRFSGMFGADAVERKYGREGIPAEWTAMLLRLNDFQIQRGIRQLAYSGKQHVPSLPEFVKLCRDAEHDQIPASMPALPNPTWQGDNWDIAASNQLLGYLTRKIPEEPRRYGDPGTPRHAQNIHVLVAFKNRWAELMRESATEDGVPGIEQAQCWNECMRMAEAQIAQKEAA